MFRRSLLTTSLPKMLTGKSESDLEDTNKKSPELTESVSESSSECSVVENDSNLENVVEEKPLEHVPKKTAERVCEFKRLAELQGHKKVYSSISIKILVFFFFFFF